MIHEKSVFAKALRRLDRCQMALDKAKTHGEAYRAEGATRAAQRHAMRTWLLTTPEGRAARVRHLYTPNILEMTACAAVARALTEMKAGAK
jgi:hypothetical protein